MPTLAKTVKAAAMSGTAKIGSRTEILRTVNFCAEEQELRGLRRRRPRPVSGWGACPGPRSSRSPTEEDGQRGPQEQSHGVIAGEERSGENSDGNGDAADARGWRDVR
jgi:hypothetical protein